MATIADVARHAGVSNGTVSRYFHEPDRVSTDTRKKIELAIETLGYTPNMLARSFRMGSTGIVIVLTTSIGDAFSGDVVAGIGRIARMRGYIVRIEQPMWTSLRTRDLGAFIQSRQADGIIVIGSPWPFESALSMDTLPAYPIAVCGETTDPELERYPRFQINGQSAAFELTEFLIGQGHRCIGFIGGAFDSVNLREREIGYRESMAVAGLVVDDGWVIETNMEIEDGRRAIQDLLNTRETPTAIICVTDDVALGAMAELRSRGIRVPEDISIAGFDDTRYAAVANPPLTTVAQPAHAIGERAMSYLVKAMTGTVQAATTEYLPHKLIIRESTRSMRRSSSRFI